MRRRNAKRTLLGSLVTMLLSCAMLFGTTFAWFTDSVATGASTIRAGNLGLKLEYAFQPADGEALSWHDAEDVSALFGTDTLWEPGYTGIVYFRVTNTGALALKYRCTVQVENNTIGKNVSGGDIDLREYVQLAVAERINGAYTDRDAALSAQGDSLKLLTERDPSATGAREEISVVYRSADAAAAKLAGTGESHILAMVVRMPDTVGNEANHDGTNIPSFQLRVTVDAAQALSESDSFGEDYDSAATYPTT